MLVDQHLGRLAQLARASPLQGEGRGFESLNAHQFAFQSVDFFLDIREPLQDSQITQVLILYALCISGADVLAKLRACLVVVVIIVIIVRRLLIDK